MLKTEKLTKRYGEMLAISQLDLCVQPGQVYALLGPNGAGKTTTINCCLGFTTPDGGRVLINGADPAKDPEAARRSLAYIPEQVSLYPWLSGSENLDYFAQLGGRRCSEAELRSYLTEAGLQPDAFGRMVGGYSKGMRQKVGIAIALAKRASVLLLDEPTSGLDPRASREFSELIRQLRAKNVAILMATHDLFRALDIATRIGIMFEGQLRAEVDPAQVKAGELERIYLDKTSVEQLAPIAGAA